MYNLCVRGALSCQFGDRGQSEYHSEKARVCVIEYVDTREVAVDAVVLP